jgi:hypothetical protein
VIEDLAPSQLDERKFTIKFEKNTFLLTFLLNHFANSLDLLLDAGLFARSLWSHQLQAL